MKTWSHFLVSCFFWVEPHLRIAGGIHGIHGLDGVAVMAKSFAKQLRGADATQVAQVLRQEIRSWCRGKTWGLFLGGKNGSRLKEISGRTDMKDECISKSVDNGHKTC